VEPRVSQLTALESLFICLSLITNGLIYFHRVPFAHADNRCVTDKLVRESLAHLPGTSTAIVKGNYIMV